MDIRQMGGSIDTEPPMRFIRVAPKQSRQQLMPTDHVRTGPDAPIENFIIRIVHAHTNDRQHGARTIEMYRSIPERFEPATDEGQELIAAALATLVDDGTLKTVEHDGITYYRLAE